MPTRLLLLALLWLTGCASHPVPQPSHVLPASDSPLTRRIDALAADLPYGQSGFRLLSSSADAFQARAEMIRAATVSLDLQYYIVEDGLSTRLLFDELMDAADRGVRVRLLIDDTTTGDNALRIADLAAHPNLEVRVFNPLHIGRATGVTRLLGRFLNLAQQHQRMHNKLFLADGTLAIVGGRNLGDSYFNADRGLNFTDIDLLVAGPAARDLGHSFDLYWNHRLSIPLEHFQWFEPGRAELAEARARLSGERTDRRDDDPRYRRLTRYRRAPALDDWLGNLHWARGHAYWDHPDKLLAEGVPKAHLLLTTQLAPALEGVEDELTLVSAYFVPTEPGMRYFTEKAHAGVELKILTNSLEATDVPVVHGGYAPYRIPLLELGAELYELRRQPEEDVAFSVTGSSESALHSKAAIFDRERVFLGSLNFDPRSILWNSEVGVLVDSPWLAGKVHELTEQGMHPAVSYQVKLSGPPDDRQLVWVAEDGGKLRVLTEEPGSRWRKFNAWLARFIGLERML